MDARKVLVVDDDKLVRNHICRTLSEHYQLLTAENGSDGIDAAKKEHPDIILLDVEMPGINGFEVCDKLKQDADTQDSLIVFLSGHSSLRERMQGYEAGAADYLVKPFDAPELLAKMKHMASLISERHSLSARAQTASQTAFAAMRGSSELGMAIQFIEATYNAASLGVIANKFFDVMKQLDLNCTLMFRGRQEPVFFSSKGAVSPLERELITTLHQSGRRFTDFGCRTQINYPRVAVLAKNMPLHDQEAYGRYKDFLPTMMGSTDSKVKALNTEQALVEQTQNLTSSFAVVRDTLEQVGKSLQGNQHKVLTLLRTTIDELDTRIPTMGLEDDQEKYLITTLDGAIQSTHNIIDSGESANSAFQTVCRLLEHLSERQQRLLDDVTCDEQPQNLAGGASQDSKISGDVELF